MGMEVVGNVIETCDKEAGQKLLLKGSHVHMDILMNHMKDLEKMQGEMLKVQNNLRTRQATRGRSAVPMLCLWMAVNCVIRNTKSVGIMWRKCQLKRKILVGRAGIVTWR